MPFEASPSRQMGTIACVHVPALPLQLLLARHPEWRGRPAAVVDRDSPQGRILWVDGRARRRRILPGMRYAAALALDGELGTRGRSQSADREAVSERSSARGLGTRGRSQSADREAVSERSSARGLVAGVVERQEIDEAVDELTRRLLKLTPGVEPQEEDPGVFFLDATGLGRLWPSLEAWAETVAAELVSAGVGGGAAPAAEERRAAKPRGRSAAATLEPVVRYRGAAVVVGHTRFGTYAVARTRQGVTVFADREAERRAAARIPLARLGLDPELRDALARLGVATVGELLTLPAGGLAERFGPEALRLYRQAAGTWSQPLEPERPAGPLLRDTVLEQPDGDATRLLFLAKRLLDPLLAELAGRGEALVALALTLRLEDGSQLREALKPARPTRDGPQLLELVRLRLEGVRLPCRVEEVALEVESTAAEAGQLQLFPVNARRDPEAGARALARLEAELGEAAVVKARLADRWLPEGAFLWEPVGRLELPAPGETSEPRLVRRILTRSRPLPPRTRHLRDDGWLIRGVGHGAVTRLVGPYTLSGGWWFGGMHRDYYFAETRLGELLWVYNDHKEDRWFLQGEVR